MTLRMILIWFILVLVPTLNYSQVLLGKHDGEYQKVRKAKRVEDNIGLENGIDKSPLVPPTRKILNPLGKAFGSNSYSYHSAVKPIPNYSKLKAQEKFHSIGGQEVKFEVPTASKKTGICATPFPVVENELKMPGCPNVVPCDDPVNRDANIPSPSDPTIFFKLNWIVFLNGGAGTNIDQNQIDLLMTEVNNDFAPWNIQFCADPGTFIEDGTYYNLNSASEDPGMKTTYGVNPTEFINIYIVNNITNPNAGGYARFPYDPWGGTDIHGGVVMSQGNSNLGTHTLAHELGHTFGLYHTFHGVDEVSTCTNCYETVGFATGAPVDGDTDGDRCSDTNPHPTNAYVCADPPGPNNGCDLFAWNNVPVNNHMSYSFCTSQFTAQQAGRMYCMINTYLSDWLSYGGATCGSLPPVPDFTGTPQIWQAPSNVTFTDESIPASTITSWAWDFDVGNLGGVTPATFNGQNPPVVAYSNPGLYTVSLTVTNINGSQTETKTDYVEVLAPAGDCDTLDTQWNNPTPSPTVYSFEAGDFYSGVPAPTYNGGGVTDLGLYEMFFAPNPGTTVVGGVRVGLAELDDADDDMVIQVVIYQDDGTGAPDFGAGILGGVAGLSPTFDLGVPAAGSGFFTEVWIPFFNAVTIPTATFHVGVEIFQGDATDQLVVMTTCDGPPGCTPPSGQGENDDSNHVLTWNFGLLNYNFDIGSNLDLNIVPMLGEYAPLPLIEGYIEDVRCDTTFTLIFDTVFFSTPVSWEFLFSDGSMFNSTTDPEILLKTYLTQGPDTIAITTINECGRVGQTSWIIPYNFLTTPQADFDKDMANPSCLGPPGITFTSSTSNMADYSWDFGDGATQSSGTNPTVNHQYGAVGTYYVSLTTTGSGYLPDDTIFLEDFEGGIPGSFTTIDNDGLPDFYGIFNGAGWLGLDIDLTGDNEAVSTSWYVPPGTSDDWLITPQISLNANSSLYWDAEATDVGFPDGYEVRISTSTPTIAAFLSNPVLFATTAENAYLTRRNVNLEAAGYASQNVYIAFRNNSVDQNLLTIDNILIGTTSLGCSDIEQKWDFVEKIDCTVVPPSANFSFSPTTGCIGNPISFTDLSSGSPDPATSWLWDFDDGSFSVLQNPTHAYGAAGVYQVKQIAYNAGGSDTLTIAVSVINCGPLPIELISFNADNRIDHNYLYWSTASEIQSDYFSLFRNSGHKFELIALVESAGNSQYQVDYDWNDYNPPNGVNYYRLDHTDLNGDITFSEILSIDNRGENSIQIFPNPTDNILNIILNQELTDFTRIEVMNAIGQIVLQKTTNKTEVMLDVSSWPTGIYQFRFSGDFDPEIETVIIN